MLMSEVARTYEAEITEIKKQMNAVIAEKDAKISNLKQEALREQEKVMELQSKVYSEREAFARLNESFLILQHHNEEGLALRLQTEARLSELFRRDRQQLEIIATTAKDRKVERRAARERDAQIEELEFKAS